MTAIEPTELARRKRRNGGAKITEAGVCQARLRYARGESGLALAEEYGMHQTSMYALLIGKTWKHLPHAVPKQVTADLETRFWSRMEKGPGCWLWQGSYSRRQGYGGIWYRNQKKVATHVAIWVATGQWPAPGLFVCHHCDNPRCVRPDHLFVGTASDNMRDMVIKGRRKAKLTIAQAAEIKSLHGKESRASLAARFGIKPNTVSMIQNNRLWKVA